MKDEKPITVVFLMWMPYGFGCFDTFIRSYLQHPAGIPHQLLVIFKDGDHSEPAIVPYINLLDQAGIEYTILHFDGGFDIDAYSFAAKNLETDFIFFFNTSSIILADEWLKKMHAHMLTEKTGMVSATGSWQSYRSSILHQHTWKYETGKSVAINVSKYKLLLKAVFYYPSLFPSFPNPHLRTNAFIMRKTLFNKMQWKPLTSKFRAYLCESGRNSITQQVIKMGYAVLVADKNGIAYRQEEWPDSYTFRVGQQQNLIVSDNQTRIYEKATQEDKNEMSYLAWGIHE